MLNKRVKVIECSQGCAMNHAGLKGICISENELPKWGFNFSGYGIKLDNGRGCFALKIELDN